MHDKRAEELIIAKIREIRGVKSVQSNLKVEEIKQVVSGSTLITELTQDKDQQQMFNKGKGGNYHEY